MSTSPNYRTPLPRTNEEAWAALPGVLTRLIELYEEQEARDAAALAAQPNRSLVEGEEPEQTPARKSSRRPKHRIVGVLKPGTGGEAAL